MLSQLRRAFATTSAMKLDSTVVELLGLNPDTTSVSSAGGGGDSSAVTSKITTVLDDGSEKKFFMKTGSGKDAEIMFAGKSRLNNLRISYNDSNNTHIPYQANMLL